MRAQRGNQHVRRLLQRADAALAVHAALQALRHEAHPLADAKEPLPKACSEAHRACLQHGLVTEHMKPC